MPLEATSSHPSSAPQPSRMESRGCSGFGSSIGSAPTTADRSRRLEPPPPVYATDSTQGRSGRRSFGGARADHGRRAHRSANPFRPGGDSDIYEEKGSVRRILPLL